MVGGWLRAHARARLYGSEGVGAGLAVGWLAGWLDGWLETTPSARPNGKRPSPPGPETTKPRPPMKPSPSRPQTHQAQPSRTPLVPFPPHPMPMPTVILYLACIPTRSWASYRGYRHGHTRRPPTIIHYGNNMIMPGVGRRSGAWGRTCREGPGRAGGAGRDSCGQMVHVTARQHGSAASVRSSSSSMRD